MWIHSIRHIAFFTGIKLLLKREGAECEILEAENGKVALGILMDRKVDILFSDIKMPYMNRKIWH